MKKASAVSAPVAVATPVIAKAVAVTRLSLADAKRHNATFKFVTDDNVVAANVALTAKGANTKKLRVYGYDNLSDGGGVPKDKKVALVAGFTGVPKGVAGPQWDKLVAHPGLTVIGLRDAGVTSRTVRRAYRAGAIRFLA